jgi:hypothetical protein
VAVGGAGSFSTLPYHSPEVLLARRSKMMPVTATGTTGGNKEHVDQIRAAHCAQVRGESWVGMGVLVGGHGTGLDSIRRLWHLGRPAFKQPLAMMETGYWMSLRPKMQAVVRAEASAIEEHRKWPLVPGRMEVA